MDTVMIEVALRKSLIASVSQRERDISFEGQRPKIYCDTQSMR